MKQAKKVWEPIKVKYVGLIGNIINMGGGKLSTAGGDPGESRKNRSGLGE